MPLKPIRKALFETVGVELSHYGFTLRAAKDQFTRTRNRITDRFQLVCLDGKPGYRIQPNVGVRFDLVEDIFHQTSGFDSKYQKGTPTIGNAVGEITDNDAQACEFILERAEEVPSVAQEIVHVFRTFALQYFEKFSSLVAIDIDLNSLPTQRTPNRGAPWLRCSTGLIVAKLVGRPNYDQLVEIYTNLMNRVDKGFYLKRFQALVKSLDSVQAVGQSSMSAPSL